MTDARTQVQTLAEFAVACRERPLRSRDVADDRRHRILDTVGNCAWPGSSRVRGARRPRRRGPRAW
ncbi:hypothetical protein ACU686_13470 [Yinghuangia aomiensis]